MRQRQTGVRLNITPLIDVVFLLIIFFLVASHFIRTESLEEVELPEATQSEPQHEKEGLRRLVVTITGDRRMHVGGGTVTTAELESRIRQGRKDYGSDFEVRLRTDRSVPYETVEPIMLACAQSGVTHIKFAVILK